MNYEKQLRLKDDEMINYRRENQDLVRNMKNLGVIEYTMSKEISQLQEKRINLENEV